MIEPKDNIVDMLTKILLECKHKNLISATRMKILQELTST